MKMAEFTISWDGGGTVTGSVEGFPVGGGTVTVREIEVPFGPQPRRATTTIDLTKLAAAQAHADAMAEVIRRVRS